MNDLESRVAALETELTEVRKTLQATQQVFERVAGILSSDQKKVADMLNRFMEKQASINLEIVKQQEVLTGDLKHRRKVAKLYGRN